MNIFFFKLASNDVTSVCLKLRQNPLGQVFGSNDREATRPDFRRRLLDDKKRRKRRVSKGPHTETFCADIPYIAVKNTKVVINENKFRIMSLFFIVTVDKI